MKLKLFFSHAWADKAGAKVKKLLLLLQKNYDVWLDKKQIDIGNHINDTVAKGIADCNIFIAVWSSNAHKSKGVQFELETAAKLNKPILVLLIEDYDVANSPYLAGKEYIDFSGDALAFAQQEIYLGNFLLRQQLLSHQQQFANDPSKKEALDEIAKQSAALQDMLIQLEDNMYRQKNKVSGNDDSDVYIQSSLNAFEQILKPEEAEGNLMLRFAATMKEISAKYPLQQDDKTKKRLAIKAIEALDPAGHNENLMELKIAFENDLGITSTAPVATLLQTPVTTTPQNTVAEKFAAQMKDIAAKYPYKQDDKTKKRLAVKAIAAIDPAGTDSNLAILKTAFQKELSVPNKKNVSKKIPQLQQQLMVLIESYKVNVEKTKQTVLDKSKSVLDGLPIFNLLASFTKTTNEFEMSYITNSPAILQKMYSAALLSKNKELQGLVTILIQHITETDLQKAAQAQKINAFMPYAYLINNTARLLVQAKALKEEDVSHSLLSSLGLDKIGTFFFKEDWKEKAERFLEMVKNNYGITDKNLNWLKTAAAIVGVALVADSLGDFGDGDAHAIAGDAVNTGSSPVYFEDKMAAMGFSVPNMVQY